MASSLSSSFPAAHGLAMRVERDLAHLESGGPADEDGGGYEPLTAESRERLLSSVSAGVDELGRCVPRLENLLHREPPNRREMWRGRVGRLAEQHMALRSAADRHWRDLTRAQRERAVHRELFEGASDGNGAVGSVVDARVREGESLERSRAAVEQLKSYGRSVLSGLEDQGSLLKSARTKLWDVANTIGLSSSVMRAIGRREQGDRWLVYGGMAITLAVLFALYNFYL